MGSDRVEVSRDGGVAHVELCREDKLNAMDGEMFAAINKEWKEQKGVEKFADNNDEALRQVLFAPDAPANLPRGEIPRLWEVKVAEESRRLQRKIEELEATHEGAPPRAIHSRSSFKKANTSFATKHAPHFYMKRRARAKWATDAHA